MTSREILIALTRRHAPFCSRRHIAVPNVYWGWGLDYEADLIAVSKSGVCTEIEIKISKSDMKADRQKAKWRRGLGEMISRFYYAVPFDLKDFALLHIPETAGLIVISQNNPPRAEIARRAATNKAARKPTADEILKLHHLGLMRFWDLMLKASTEDRGAALDPNR